MTVCQITRLDSFRLIPAIFIPGSRFSVLESISPTFLSANRSSFLLRSILMLLIAITLDKNAPKYGGQGKRCCLKHTVIFQQKCWWNRTAWSASSTVRWALRVNFSAHEIWVQGPWDPGLLREAPGEGPEGDGDTSDCDSHHLDIVVTPGGSLEDVG